MHQLLVSCADAWCWHDFMWDCWLLQGLVYPLDTVRTRLAVCSSTEYGGIWSTASKLWRTEGLAAFYRGLVPSMVRQS
jgi:hypothetical protein